MTLTNITAHQKKIFRYWKAVKLTVEDTRFPKF